VGSRLPFTRSKIQKGKSSAVNRKRYLGGGAAEAEEAANVIEALRSTAGGVGPHGSPGLDEHFWEEEEWPTVTGTDLAI
jgi:hypothetical protein